MVQPPRGQLADAVLPGFNRWDGKRRPSVPARMRHLRQRGCHLGNRGCDKAHPSPELGHPALLGGKSSPEAFLLAEHGLAGSSPVLEATDRQAFHICWRLPRGCDGTTLRRGAICKGAPPCLSDCPCHYPLTPSTQPSWGERQNVLASNRSGMPSIPPCRWRARARSQPQAAPSPGLTRTSRSLTSP